MIEIKQEHTKNNGKFIVYYDAIEAGYLKYDILTNNDLKANGTLVYDDYRDKKLGTPLFNAFINFVKANNLKVYPTCPYIVAMFEKHTELANLLSNDYQN